MNMWLDDVREPWKYGYIGWEWVKNATDAIELLKTGRVERASLDHDLVIAHYSESRDDGFLFVDDGRTGYSVTLFLLENSQYFPSEGVNVHSLSEKGRARMLLTLKKAAHCARSSAYVTSTMAKQVSY